MSKNAISLMESMLRMDPKERFTALDALGHSYFDTVRDDEVEEIIRLNKEKLSKQIDLPHHQHEISRSKDLSRRKTSTEKHVVKQNKKNPYSLPLGASPPQFKKKKPSNKLYKDKKSSSSIKNLLQGRSSSKDIPNKRNVTMNSYDNSAYPKLKGKRNPSNNDSLRENQSMGNYIPSAFNGLYVQNAKNANEKTEYDYEIGGDFGPKGVIASSNKIDNSVGIPSQIYGTNEPKNSLSASVSGILSKGPRQNHMTETHDQRKIPSLSPSGRSEDSKTNFRQYNTSMINKVVNQKKKTRMMKLFENPSNEVSHLESINETLQSKNEQKSSYYEEEKSQRTVRGSSKQKKRSSLKTRENTERRAIHKYKQRQPKQSFKDKNAMSIIDFNQSAINQENEYNYEIPDSRDTTQINNETYHNSSAQFPFL